MKKSILIICTLLCSLYMIAQPASTIRLEQYIAAAEKAENKGNVYEALQLYTEANSKYNSTDLLPKLVKHHYLLRNYEKAVNYGKSYMKKQSKEADPNAVYTYARALKSLGKYKEAIKQLGRLEKRTKDKDFLEKIQMEKQGAEQALSAITPKGITLGNLNTINNSSSEYSPHISANKDLYYSALNNTNVVDLSKDKMHNSKIYRASYDNGYAKAKALPSSINNPRYHQANVTLSPDGNTMVFVRQTLSGESTIESSQLYMSSKTNGVWSQPIAISSKDALYKSPSFGKYMDKDVLFFVSNKKGGIGAYDIYYAQIMSDGKLGKSHNMGPPINTPHNEESPYYKSGILYFSSTGHVGYGGYDIYKTQIADTESTTVEHMGLPYNSSADDIYFMMADDYRGALVSNRADPDNRSILNATCCNDIYTVDLVKLELETVIADSDTDRPITDARVVVRDGNNNIVEASEYDKYMLRPDSKYTVEISRKGYETESKEIRTDGMWSSQVIKENVSLKPSVVVAAPPPKPKTKTPEVITYAEPIVLEEILFDYNDDKILTRAESDLRYLKKIMDTYPDMKIRISSHTDARGSQDYNQKLSQRRSDSVRNWLIRRGIDRNRVTASGLGSSRPLKAYNKVSEKYSFIPEGTILDAAFIAKLTKTQQDIVHQLNRRSEFEIIEGPKVILRKK